MGREELDLERQKKAKQYARVQRRLMVLELGLGVIYIFVWLSTGWSQSLENLLQLIFSQRWFLVLAFVFIFGGVYLLITFPITYYEGFHLPHFYELSNQSLCSWTVDQIKVLAISVLLGGLIIEIIYLLIFLMPVIWWLWTGIVLVLFNVILANLAPILLFPIFYKFSPLDEERPELVERMLNLADRTGTKIQGVYKFDMSQRTKAANAALAGLGNTRRIILGDTLLTEFTDDEIETVLAHELAHQVHGDIPLGIAFSSILTLGGLYLAHLGLDWGVSYFGYQSVADIAAFPLFLLVIGAYGLLTMPISNAFSRWREHRADFYSLQVTHKPEDFASAMTRLANQNLSEIDPESWVEFLFYSHPSLSKRIKYSQEWRENSS
jgi:STE24 endopeptidase